MGTPGSTVSVDGHRIALTNLDKVLYPETGTTKRDVIEYYSRVAEWMLPHLADRPVTRKRWVHGVGTDDEPGAVFFQKNADERSTPSWVRTRTIVHTDHQNVYPLVNDLATLVWLSQIAALELHVPQWRFGPHGARRNPDRLVLDLDPGEDAGLAECVEVAELARELLEGVGLEPMPVTSGSKGIHLYCGLDGSRTSEQLSAFAHELARSLEADHPDLVVSDMKKSLRRGRVLVDWSQNNGAKTTIGPYSLRGRSRPTVAAPRTWRELARRDLRQLEFGEVLDRLRRRGDPLAGLGAAHPEAGSGARGAHPELAPYRAKRDEARTPEPFGDAGHRAGATGEGGPIFVIQEHHARRLHWDFRLERDGVLVSWALPRGMPEDPAHNRLAVHVEDHPLDYAGFAGDIPHGEYGAGHVEIWDSGVVETEKWRDDEVIVVLRGTRGVHRYALIRTGVRDGKDQWLIHLTKDQPDGAPTPSGRTRARAPRLAPMLATAGSDASIPARQQSAWAYEMKWDGVRAIAVVRDGAVTLSSRSGGDLTASFPELAALADALDGDAVLDGEIVALDSRARPSFSRLQHRLGVEREGEVAAARRETPVSLLLFDALELNGDDLTGLPYEQRRNALLDAVRQGGPVRVPSDAGARLDDALETSRELGLEGVMAKLRDSPYRPGRRSDDWIKIKHSTDREVVVIGWRTGNGARADTLGSLLVAIPDQDGALRYAGRVGSGFRDRDLVAARTRLDRLARATPPIDDVPAEDSRDAHWVRAELVGEVRSSELTPDGRLRHPVWRGWRVDKAPGDVR